MGRLTRRINAEITKGLTYEAIIYKDIEHHETDFNYEALNKLAHYEDLEEQGRLIEQKHGQWKQSDSNFYSNIYFCSNCLVYERVKTVMGKPVFNYCPNCGAKMESEVAE